MNIKSLISRHAVVTYFVLAYALAWGGIILLLGPAGLIPGPTPAMSTVLLVFLIMLLGPSVSSIGLTTWLEGKPGLRALFARWAHWRVDARWYGVALLTTPLLLMVILLLLVPLSPVYMPSIIAASDKVTVLGFGLFIGLLAGFCEEIGWTGFAIPRLLTKHSVLATGLMVGLLWGTWHLLGDFWGNAGTFGSLYLMRGLLWVLTLTAYRVLMVWVYSRTSSLVLAQLMHAAFTGGQAIFGGTGAQGEYLVWYGVFAAALWVGVAALAVAARNERPALKVSAA